MAHQRLGDLNNNKLKRDHYENGISLYIWVSIFLNNKRCTSVLNTDIYNTIFKTIFDNPLLYITSEII